MKPKPIELQGENSTIIYNWGPFSREQKNGAENQQRHRRLQNTINQVDLTCIYRPLHATTAKYTFFWSEDGTFYRNKCARSQSNPQ